ncbi:MAG: metalloregulator ArsR/SmtB family transcription factor [Cyclobacteriaceae bacterium]|nr:metalloregulator ArsR/SmtB family transcription factor [Cyclobacteriaceae bacterium]
MSGSNEKKPRKTSPEKLGRAAEIFEGLGHPIRLEIIELLEGGKVLAVGQILESLNVEPTLLSHHLRKMKHLGIVDSKKEGRFIYYHLAILELTKVLDCIDNCGIDG